MIAVIDYGLGNLRSVTKALEAQGAKVSLTNQPKEIKEAKAIVLPGVGAFKRAMDNLASLGIIPCILQAIQEGKPFLGICLGLQLLFTESEEHGMHPGLDVLSGQVKKFASGVKIPHMGWNGVKIKKPVTSNQRPEERMDLFENIPNNSYFYFVHSYCVVPQDKSVTIATTEYGREFTCAVNKDNVWGVQFHPEKSAELGLKVLENFCRYVG